ncbi:AAA family ATPase [Geodermatophilus sp. YIM 151500]|uniref:HelD family protein n=1 Tax=Geodermatophilus sp. YIM 151500 TaxID=2984531 RepID=UPI0021E4C463|nr:AAA family ATPase [Geodermatophilus sp. YIM 151500]MCV2489787.1 AAA family ATPase [Geodermatophilus sp. YIM 151500]
MTERRDAIAQEQAAVDAAYALREELLHRLHGDLADLSPDSAGLPEGPGPRAGHLRRRVAELDGAETGLVFGRLDGLDGTVRYLGRVGIAERNAEPLVVDWRAPVARPFYTATPVDPQGQAKRRHIRTERRRVVGVDDEPLDPSARDGDLVGEGALLHALAQRRTGRMGVAVATLQREQDAVVRADATGALVVQGGPGTGKTVVALHRVAYLLFTHRPLAERGVLVIGPSTRFLDYIGQVLPALGETQVVATTCDRLVPGAVVTRTEAREAAEIKGRALWQAALTAYVDTLYPRGRAVRLVFDGEEYALPERRVASALLAARSDGRPYHAARRIFVDQVHEMLADSVADRAEELLAQAEEGYEDVLAGVDASLARSDDRGVPLGVRGSDVDGVLSEEDVEVLRRRITRDRGVAAALAAWWTPLDAGAVLTRFLADARLLRRFAPDLTPTEIGVVAKQPPGWAPSDIPLLDAVADLLGDGPPTRPVGGFTAERAAGRRDWVYGHVVVDEAQELSAMQWLMLVRRCPTRSFTAVGDVDQTEAPHAHATWADALRPAFGERWTAAELTICYRTPREVMALTGTVLDRAGSTNRPPRAVRSTGIEPSCRSSAEDALTDDVRDAVRLLRSRYRGGTVGVISPPGRQLLLQQSVGEDVPVLSPAAAKGLEFDATVVVDPDGIAAGSRGWNALYVALTRCTQELVQITVGADQEAPADPGRPGPPAARVERLQEPRHHLRG